jgi:hypothetical protein
MTTFGDQVFQFGGVPIGGGMLPAMAPGARAVFVHGSLGLAGNSGLRPSEPVATLTQAYALCTDGAGDVVYIMNDGGTGASVRDVALVWAKDNCHIVGLGAPAINQRVRIAPPTTSAVDVDAYTPYLTLSASGCIINNVSWFQGQSEDGKPSVGIKVTGSRNYLSNVSVITGAHANQGDEATNYQVQVTGSENVFEKCYIGQDTAPRSNFANANLKFGSGASDEATRNVFRDCIFPMFADGAAPVFVQATANDDVQRWNLMERCTFVNTGTSTITQGVSWAATGGILLLKDCAFQGLTDITTGNNVRVLFSGAALGSANDSGMFGTATTS